MLSPLAFLLLGSAAFAQGDSPVVAGELGARIDEHMSRLAAFGLSGSLLVAKDGEVIVRKGYGMADDAAGTPVSADMPFLIGSLSKQFTAAAVLKLEMQGKLGTADTLGRFFPDAPADKRGITLHQLLSHTAGLPYLEANLFSATSRDELMRGSLALPLDSPPGTGFAYSNPGYTLLAGVIERASGTTYEKYLRKNIFTPAGMSSTGYVGDGAHPKLALLHSYSGTADEGPASAFQPGADFAGSGSIYSTVGDLYRWQKALEGETVLSKEAVKKFFAPHAPIQGDLSYAYGWNTTKTIRNTRLIFHAGDLGGYNAEFRRYPDEGLVMIFTSNRRENGIGYRAAVMNPLSLLVAGAKYPAPPAVAELPAAKLRSFAGNYRLSTGGSLLAWTEGERLMVGAEGEDALALLAGGTAVDSLAMRELSAATRQIVTAGIGGDFEPLKNHLHPSYPFENVREGLIQHMMALRDSLGEFIALEDAGSVMLTPTTAQSYFRLRFQRGSVLQMYGWAGDKISAIDDEVTVAMRTRFAPASGEEIVSFDPFTGRSIRISFTADPGGVSGLTVMTPSGPVAARRTSGKG